MWRPEVQDRAALLARAATGMCMQNSLHELGSDDGKAKEAPQAHAAASFVYRSPSAHLSCRAQKPGPVITAHLHNSESFGRALCSGARTVYRHFSLSPSGYAL
jgi:hypothetical protein